MEGERERERPPPTESARFLDEAPEREESDPGAGGGPDPNEESSVLFAEEAGLEASEEAPPLDPSEDSGVHLADVAPGASGEVRAYQEKLATQAEAEEAKREEREELPPKIRARPAPMITAAADEVGVAHCPACQAKNPSDALRCGRCGAEIPPAIPTARGPKRYKTFGEEREGLGDPRDVLPTYRRAELADQDAARNARYQESRQRWLDYRKRVVLASATLFVVIGAITSLLSFSSWVMVLFGVLLDGACGAVAADRLVAERGGKGKGLLLFGMAGVVSALLKLGMGTLAMLTSGTIAAFIIFLIAGTIGASAASGLLAGLMVEMEAVDQG
jgi:hypothetical protein